VIQVGMRAMQPRRCGVFHRYGRAANHGGGPGSRQGRYAPRGRVTERRAILLRRGLAEEVGRERRLLLPAPVRVYARARAGEWT